MLKNYVLVAVRALRKHPGTLLINVFGLALGIACCLLIFLFVREEWSFDRFHEDADRLYRVAVREDYGDDQVFFNSVSPLPLADALADRFPEIETTARVAVINDLVEHEGESFSERIHMVDPGFFEVFDFPLTRGAPDAVLEELKSIVLTEATAERFFGEADPIGQTLLLQVGDTPEPFRVTGVAEDPPTHSSIRFTFVIPIENGRAWWNPRVWTSFTNVLPETYVRLPEGADAAALEARTEPVIGPMAMGDDYQPGMYRLLFQPITDIHLNPEFPVGNEPISDPRYAAILATIALLVLLVACINFTTLSLGRSADRAKEVGVRKVVGAGRMQLVQQFWSEALAMTLLALLAGVGLAVLLLPAFNSLAGKTLALTFDAPMVLALLALLVVVGLVAGSYPALVLSRFRPIEVLAGRLRLGGAGLFRKGLTVVQFALSMILLISAFMMTRQLRLLQEQPLGFDREAVVVMPTGLNPDEGMELVERFRAELAGHDAVAGVAGSVFTFGEGWIEASFTDETGVFRPFVLNIVDPGFLELMGVEMVAGRTFSREMTADARDAVIVNEAFVDAFGWSDPLQARIPGTNFPPHRIIGVVEDFNFASLHTPVEPLAMVVDPAVMFEGISDVGFSGPPQPKISARIRTADVAGSLALLEQTWQAVAPSMDFSYTFLDETLEQQYRQEQRLGTIVRVATIFAILIACLGLFGLAALTAAKRTKEVGIRKVLGASTAHVVLLLTKDVVFLVALAFLFAAPVAYFAMRTWLQDFAYRAPLGVDVFALAGLLVVAVALLTAGIQALRAALRDPVDSLRYE